MHKYLDLNILHFCKSKGISTYIIFLFVRFPTFYALVWEASFSVLDVIIIYPSVFYKQGSK